MMLSCIFRFIDGSAADYIFNRLCVRKDKVNSGDQHGGETTVVNDGYTSQELIKWFWECTGLSYTDNGFCRHSLGISPDGQSIIGQSPVSERLLAFTILAVFLDQVIYTHFKDNFNHSSGFGHPESTYHRFSKIFRLPKYFSCSASGGIGNMVPATALLELQNCVDDVGFYSEIDKLSRLLLADIYGWFRVNIGHRAQFILHNYLLAEIAIEIGGCDNSNPGGAENKISCLLKTAAESVNANETIDHAT